MLHGHAGRNHFVLCHIYGEVLPLSVVLVILKSLYQPRPQGLSSSLLWSGREVGKKRDPGDEVESTCNSGHMCGSDDKKMASRMASLVQSYFYWPCFPGKQQLDSDLLLWKSPSGMKFAFPDTISHYTGIKPGERPRRYGRRDCGKLTAECDTS